MNRARVNRWRERHPEKTKREWKSRGLTWDSWRGMLDRCRREGHIGWEYYGGRGIKVCEAWKSYEIFVRDMGERPGKEYTIDRINNDGDYEPGNCRWATWLEQRHNSRAKLGASERVLTAEQYQKKLAANKRWRQRNPEKMRAIKRAQREKKNRPATPVRAGVEVELKMPEDPFGEQVYEGCDESGYIDPEVKRRQEARRRKSSGAIEQAEPVAQTAELSEPERRAAFRAMKAAVGIKLGRPGVPEPELVL